MAKTNWIKSGAFSFLANIVTIGFAFVSFLILVRLFPKQEFGVWVVYLTLTSFAEMTRMGMVQNGLIKFLSSAKTKEEKGAFQTAGLVLSSITAIVTALILLAFSPWLAKWFNAPQLPYLLLLYPLYALIFGSVKLLDFIQMAHHQFKGIFISNFIFGLGMFGSIAVFWWFNKPLTLTSVVWIQISAAVASLIFSIFYARKWLHFSKQFKKQLWQLVHFGKYVFGTNFSSMLFNRMDTIMLGIFTSPSVVALYNIPTRINNYMDVPLNSVAQIVYPKISERYAKEGLSSVTYLYERSVGLLLAVTIPMIIGIALFAKWIVWLMAGNSYLEAVPFVVAFAIMSLLKPYGRIMGITLDAIGKPKLNFYLLLFSLIINFALNFLFIPSMGITGAVIGTFSAVWLTIIGGQFIIRRFVPVNYFHPFIYMIRFYKEGILKIKSFFSKTSPGIVASVKNKPHSSRTTLKPNEL